MIGGFLNTNTTRDSKLMQVLRNWRARLSPVFGVGILGLFLYWMWIFRENIIETLKNIGLGQLIIIIALIVFSSILTVYVLVILVQDKGYPFGFFDGYNALNLSQLASMIPGGIWGYAGFAGFLWTKGISKVDSVIIIMLNTLIMLSACALVGISGLISILGWGYAAVCLAPFLVLLFGRDWLNSLKNRFYPDSSPLPSSTAMLKSFFIGIIIWAIISSCFAWLLYTKDDANVIPFWRAIGAYATGYLGGYVSILVPSGLGVSEGLVALMLGPYIGSEEVLAVAIAFRIIHTFIIWCNILLSVILTSGKIGKK